MKKCPLCGREYDNTMSFCLDDGAELLYGPGPSDGSALSGHIYSEQEPPTAVLRETRPGDAGTGVQLHTTEQTAVLPSGTGQIFRSQSFDKRLLLAPVALVLVAVGGFFAYRYLGSTTSGQIDSIAVLPFENRSGTSDADYLSDGLTDSLIFRFSQLPDIRVSPTSSVMRYKGKADDIAAIARELGVDAVLSGQLMQLGDNLTISVELVDARTQQLVWKEQYDRKMADLLATQREIAATLTQKIQLRLAGDEQGIAKKYTDSNDAYQLYLKGRHHWSRRTRDDILKAIDNYKKAIEIDPNFALAYAATAEAYNSMGKNPDAPPKDCIPQAKQAATRALEIDPELAQAHSALADSLALYDWDWVGAQRHFDKAIELDPKISYTYVAYSSLLFSKNRPAEAVTALEQAVSLEPLSMIANCILTTTYIYDRKFDKAVAQGRSTYDLDPTFPFAAQWLSFALIASGKYDEPITIGGRVPQDAPFAWLTKVSAAIAFARQGKRTEAEREIGALRELSKTRYVRPYSVAWVYASLGDKDRAFAELEKAFAERDVYLGRLAVDPFMDPLRDDPRFDDLLRRMNLK